MLFFLDRHWELLQPVSIESTFTQDSRELPSESALVVIPGEESEAPPIFSASSCSAYSMDVICAQFRTGV